MFRAHNSGLIFWLSKQEILEKFEFLPIKCKIQRAEELFSKSKTRLEEDLVCSKIKSKVSQDFIFEFVSVGH